MSRKRNYRKENDTKQPPKEGKSPSSEEKESNVNDSSTNSSSEMPSKRNDPEWYARDPRILDDAARIPFNYPLGKQLQQQLIDLKSAGGSVKTVRINSSTNRGIPGICTVKVKPSIGIAYDRLSPVNVAANALYTHVRYVNSGRKNYDPNDLMMYCLTFGDIYSAVMWLQRIYAMAFQYSQRNWYIGGEMLKSNGINPDVIVANLANFRYWLNTFINKVSSYAVPGDIYYFRRRAFMFANYYIENSDGNIRDQLYQFAPDGFWKFDYTNGSDNDGGLNTPYLVQRACPSITVAGDFAPFCSFFDHLLDNVDGDEDFGIMSGDILKAYGSNILGIQQIPEDYSIMPIYDPFILSQFKNAVAMYVRSESTANQRVFPDAVWMYERNGVKFWRKDGNVYQDPLGGVIQHGYAIRDDEATGTLAISEQERLLIQIGMDHWLSVENPDPGVGDVVEATRLTIGLGKQVDRGEFNGTVYVKTGTCKLILCGTEVVTDIEITNYQPATGITMSRVMHPMILLHTTETKNYQLQVLYQVLAEQQYCGFKYAPTLLYAAVAPTDPAVPLGAQECIGLTPISNMDNTTAITSQMLGRLHEASLLSLFFVPGVARMISG